MKKELQQVIRWYKHVDKSKKLNRHILIMLITGFAFSLIQKPWTKQVTLIYLCISVFLMICKFYYMAIIAYYKVTNVQIPENTAIRKLTEKELFKLLREDEKFHNDVMAVIDNFYGVPEIFRYEEISQMHFMELCDKSTETFVKLRDEYLAGKNNSFHKFYASEMTLIDGVEKIFENDNYADHIRKGIKSWRDGMTKDYKKAIATRNEGVTTYSKAGGS